MKIVDELYQLYRDKLTGDDEDIDMLAFAILEGMTREDLLQLITDMKTQEIYNLLGVYLIESLKEKFAQEEYGQRRSQPGVQRNIH